MSFVISSVREISLFNTFQGFAIFWFVLYIFGYLFHFPLPLAIKHISIPLPTVCKLSENRVHVLLFCVPPMIPGTEFLHIKGYSIINIFWKTDKVEIIPTWNKKTWIYSA